MATKSKQPTFQSEQEKRKWQSLQDSAGSSLSKIVEGKAKSSDIQNVSNALAGLNKLARDVFLEAVAAVGEAVRVSGADNTKVLKDGLTEYETKLNAQLKVLAPELVAQIKDAISLEVYEHTDEVTRTLGGRLLDIQNLLPPQDLPTVDDVLAANELLVEQISAEDDRKWKDRSDELFDRTHDIFRSSLEDFAVQIMRIPQIMGPPRPTNAEQASRLLGPPSAAAKQDPNVIALKEEDANAKPVVTPLPAAGDTEVVPLQPATDASVRVAADTATAWYTKAMGFLGSLKEQLTGGGSDEDAKEQKKADTWWRSFKNWVGDKYDKAKKKVEDNMGWLKALGYLLLTMVTNPELYKTLGETIQKYMTWDNLKGAVTTAWEWIKKQGTDVVDWVMGKLGLNKNGQDAKTTEQEKKIDAAEDKLNGDPSIRKTRAVVNQVLGNKQTHADPDIVLTPQQRSEKGKKQFDDNVTKVWNWTKNLFSNYSDGGMNADGSSPDAALASALRGSGSNTTPVPAPGRSSVDNSNSSNTNLTIANGAVANQTKTVNQNGVNVTPGQAVPPPGQPPVLQTPAGMGNRPAKGTTQVGLSTFGFNAGIDDSLMLANSSLFGG